MLPKCHGNTQRFGYLESDDTEDSLKSELSASRFTGDGACELSHVCNDIFVICPSTLRTCVYYFSEGLGWKT